MKSIYSFNDLRAFGINVLTGESCALSRRLLCDLTSKGRDLVCKGLGIPDISLSRDWNGGEAVGSILLDKETLQTCSILALFLDETTAQVWENEQEQLYAFKQEDIDTYQERKGEDFDLWRKYSIPN